MNVLTLGRSANEVPACVTFIVNMILYYTHIVDIRLIL